MLFDDTYRTVASLSEGSFKDRGSKFIGYLYHVKNDSEVKDIILQLRTEHPKARHFCWALRLTPDRSVFRVNDDGEPAGSAGRPILNTLLSADITDVLMVVVRYFGGTLLGVPGLINAYKTASQEAISAARIIEKTVNDVYRVEFEYLQMNVIMKLIKEENLLMSNQQYDNNCSLELSIRKSQLNQALAKLEKIPSVNLKFIGTA